MFMLLAQDFVEEIPVWLGLLLWQLQLQLCQRLFELPDRYRFGMPHQFVTDLAAHFDGSGLNVGKKRDSLHSQFCSN